MVRESKSRFETKVYSSVSYRLGRSRRVNENNQLLLYLSVGDISFRVASFECTVEKIVNEKWWKRSPET